MESTLDHGAPLATIPPFKPYYLRENIGRPQKWESPEQLEKLAIAYFEDCFTYKRPITITGLAIALGTTRTTLIDYEDETGHRSKEFSNIVKILKHYCEHYAEETMFTARNPAGAIFALKNYGWRDTPSVVIHNQQALVVPAELYSKYQQTTKDNDSQDVET